MHLKIEKIEPIESFIRIHQLGDSDGYVAVFIFMQ